MTISVYPSTEIFYPDEDGQPVAEGDIQRDYLLDSVKLLEIHFQNRPDIYVSGNLFIYYEQGVPASVIAPDIFVIVGVENRKRRSYKTWENGDKTPDFVLEVTSFSTRSQDQGPKKGTYAFLGVREYFQYDPTGDYLKPSLQGLQLIDGNYFPISKTSLPDGTVSMMSEVLGLELHLVPDGRLRFYNPENGEFLHTFVEAKQALLEAEQARLETEQALLEAEQARLETEQALLEAEERTQRLAAKLRELNIDPDSL